MSSFKQIAASAQTVWDQATQSVWDPRKSVLKTTADGAVRQSTQKASTQPGPYGKASAPKMTARPTIVPPPPPQPAAPAPAPAMPLLETASSTATDAVMPPPTAEDHTLDAQVQKLSPDSKLLFGCMSTLLDQKLSPVESRVQTLEQERATVAAQLEGMQQQMQRLELNVHAIVYAERLAKEACAHQVRAFQYDAAAINWDGLPKPRTTSTAGRATILTFRDRGEAAVFAKHIKTTRPNGMTCRPEIPGPVMRAQAPLRRALMAYRSTLTEDEQENVAIDYDPTRSIIHGTKFVVVTCQDGSIVPSRELAAETQQIVWEAIHDNDYLKNLESRRDVEMPDSEREKASRRRRSKPKTGATSSPITPPHFFFQEAEVGGRPPLRGGGLRRSFFGASAELVVRGATMCVPPVCLGPVPTSVPLCSCSAYAPRLLDCLLSRYSTGVAFPGQHYCTEISRF